MGDVGDFWNDVKSHRAALRKHWHECPACRVAYGTGTLVAPARECRNCGWLAPGKRGDDERAAASDIAAEAERAAQEAAARQAKRKLRTCSCHGTLFKSVTSRQYHEANVIEARARKRLQAVR